MTDIVERLRLWQAHDSVPLQNTMKEAADEIERLRKTLKDNNHAHDVIYEQQLAEIARLREENKKLADQLTAAMRAMLR